MRSHPNILIALVVALLGCVDARAQTTSSGMFGQRTTGSSLGPGNRTFSAGATTSSNAANAGQVTGAERFLRQNHQAGQFIGTDATAAAYALRNFSIYGATAGNRLQQGLSNLRAAAQSATQAQPGQNGVVPPFQTAVEAGFVPPQRAGQQVFENLRLHLQEARGIRVARPIQVAVEGDTAILRGEVASVRDRTLAEHLARFEPGIRTVRNELTVTAPAAGPAPAPR
jgi:osmotically-inducible protein OsmY